MSALARPAVVSSVLLACAAALHPALRTASWLPERELLVPALLLLCALALVSRALAAPAEIRAGAWLVAVGAAAGVLALGLDGVLGSHGVLGLGVRRQASSFDETGPAGRSLGLRPLGFAIGVERVTPAGGVALALPGRPPAELRPGWAVSASGFRFARPRVTWTGGAARLRLSASDGARTEVTDVGPGQPGQALGATVELERYFPEFALDAKQQPSTRSLEPRNPAALLTVTRGGKSYRAFVLQSMPGVHRVEALGITFSLLEVEPEQAVEIAVHREPFAPAVLAAGVLLALGVALGIGRARRSSPAPGAFPDAALLAAALLTAALLLVDEGRVLTWSFGLPAFAGRTELAVVGVFFGVAFLSALAATLLLAAARLAADASVLPVARGVSWLAVASGTGGLGLGLVRAAVLSEPLSLRLVSPLAAVALALALVAAVLVQRSLAASLPDPSGWLLPSAVALTALGAVALGFAGIGADGTYATPAAVSAGAAVLAGLAALQPSRIAWPAQLLFGLATIALLARP